MFLRTAGLCALLTISLFGVPTGFAQPPPTIENGVITGGITGCDFGTGNLRAECIPNYLGYLIAIIWSMVGVFFIINVMVAGFQIAIGSLTGNGNEAGKSRLRYSIIGLIVTASSAAILAFIANGVFGITL